MHPRLSYLSLAATALLLSVTSLLASLPAQAQTAQDRNAEALRLNADGGQPLNRGQFREALHKFQEALVIVREIGDRKSEGTILNNMGKVYHNALMDTFYTALQSGKMSKFEALRQAQIALITGGYQILGQQRGLEVPQRINGSLPKAVSTRLSHPNDWALFILIGNGL